ncbi:hypothetical protein IEN85_04260 [Pelagicoccus sp. NFK12]|uniref:Uncharacterized protein n=1 Tax=Pelagicoccus enzymogenes TaxID=2773457 RepID=A0A927IE61_9BACT|nr:hypothetical protein [Pelagicoccus enzymogenes]MBD5778692.1 hypothetical protein [Pelagicoccus enzymogenes]
MTQSDSPDFEFDISDLEVEREESAASKEGTGASKGEAAPSSVEKNQVSEDQTVNSDPRADFDESDRELDVFEIDDLPSADGPIPSQETGSASTSQTAESAAAAKVRPVEKIEKKPEPKPSRVLGDDDLGADVFAEIDSELGGMGLDDVIDDLMEEVEDYEAGGFVDLDEEGQSQVSSGSDGLFKMDDPDDSLRNSVDPNAEEEEAFDESPAFPSPSVDYEIPDDPEPSRSEEPAPQVAEIDESPAPQEVKPTAAEPAASVATAPTEKAPERPTRVPPDFEIPADPSPAKESQSVSPNAPAPASPVTAEAPKEVAKSPPTPPVAAAPDAAPIVNPESPSEEPRGEALETETPPVEATADSLPEEAEVLEDLGLEEGPSGVEGHEHVLFDANDLGADPAAEELESEPEPSESELEEPVAESLETETADDSLAESRESLEPTELPEASAEASEVEAEEPELASALEEPESEEETAPEEDAEPLAETAALPEEIEEEEDLSALLDAIDEEEVSEDRQLEEEAVDEASQALEDEPAQTEEGLVEKAVAPEVETLDEDLEEEDISDLIASVVEEDEDQEGSVEAAAESESLPEEEDELVELPSPEDLMGDDTSDAAPEDTEEVAAAAEAPGLVEVDEDLEEEDISSLIESAGEADPGSEDLVESEEAAPSLDVLDDDDEEIVELPVPEVPGLVEVGDDEEEAHAAEEQSADDEKPVKAAPSAEELLMRAGNLLNGDSKKPAEDASDLLDAIEEEDDEEVVALPSPDQVIADAMAEEAAKSELSDGADDEDEEVVALPDPESLMTADGEAVAVIDDDDEEDVPAPGNVADRGGDLPPPPPAPVEILDEEPPDEDLQAPVPEEVLEAEPEADDSADDEVIEDPFANEISLDDFTEGFAELDIDEEGEGLDSEDAISGEETTEGEPAEKEVAATVLEMPKPSLLWRLTHSMAVAAGLVLVGLASVLAIWKQQIVEYYEGRDIDGSALLQEIQEIGTHALSKFDEKGLYRMQWVDSEVRRLSENEIRLHAVVGARLRENLYRPVLESRLEQEKGYDESVLLETLGYARDRYPEEIGNFPERPWDRLYEISAKKEEVLPLRVTYGLSRASKEADWELSRIKVSGYKGDLEWPEGEPKHAFGENAYDIHSLEFAKVYEDYAAAAQNYVARIDRLKSREEESVLALKRENERQRDRVKMALAEGALFNGLAIVGEDAASSRDVQLVITEVREDGSFVKGVVKLTGEKQVLSKHFVGSLEFEKSMSGREQGYLSLKTVAIDAPTSETAATPFFDSHNVSRMRLRADGFRLEGDSRDLSFRLTRNL